MDHTETWTCVCGQVNSDNNCENCSRDQPRHKYTDGTCWINVYLVDRAYGGPEEGGWWYETGEAVRSTQAEIGARADTLKRDEQAWCETENRQRRSDTGSVLSEGKYVVHVENNPGEDFPKIQPHYE